MSSILQTQTTSFKTELYTGVHNLSTNTLKIALYTASADLNEATTVYTTSGEVTGTGYVAGGVTLTGVTINSSGFTAYVDFADVVFNASVTNLLLCWTLGLTKHQPISPSQCLLTQRQQH